MSQGFPLAGMCWLQCVPGCREEGQPALVVSPRVLEGCHMCRLLDIRRASSRDPGQAVFMPDLSAALPGLARCSLCWRALSFKLWARGWGISPAPRQRGQCLLGLLWVAFQVTGDQQRGRTAAGGGNLLIRYPPCFLPAGKCFDQLAQAPRQTQGPVKHPQPVLKVLAQEVQEVAAAWGEKSGPDSPELCPVLLGLPVPPPACVQVRGVMWGERAGPQ